jgi:chromate transport protein ChrA
MGTILTLIVVFGRIGLGAFGGGLAMIRSSITSWSF